MGPGLEGRRFITVLFAEIVGLKSLFNKINQEDITTVNKFCLEQYAIVATKYAGTIYRCESEFIIVIFGAPVIYEDDPERAVKTALAMIDLIPQINKLLSQRLKIEIELGLRIGLSSGNAIIRSYGNADNKEFFVIGDIIDNAAQLCIFAKPGEVLVSNRVFNTTRYLFDFVALPSTQLKEGGELTEIFHLLQIKQKPLPKHGLKNFVSPMIGREKELELLYNKVLSLEEGKGGTILVLGDQGVGKTRLWFEIKNLVKNKELPITILESSCLSYGEIIPDWPFIQIFKTIFGINDTDSPEIIKDKLNKKAKELFAKKWDEIVPYIAHLFSLSVTGERVRYLEPQELRLQVLMSARNVLLTLAKNQPLLIVIDDYQWIDSGSLEFLEFLLSGMEMAFSGDRGQAEFFFPILFIGLSRIEKERKFWQSKQKLQKKFDKNFLTIVLPSLDYDISKEIFNNLLKINDIPEKFRDDLLEKVAGNPFYLEEIIRFLVNSDLLISDFGIWKLKKDIKSIEIPEVIQSVILSRVEQLGKEERNILEIASVIGRVFFEQLLIELTELDHSVISVNLANLEDLGYIECIKKGPYSEYRFRHPLFQEVIYNSLSRERLISLHKKTGECIERFCMENIINYTELLSYQFYEAEDWIKSYDYSMQAARKAKNVYLNKEAIEFYDRALRSIRTVEQESSEKQASKALETIKEKVEIMLLTGENEKARAEIDRGISIAKKIGNKKEEAECLLLLSNVYGAVSTYDEMLETASQAYLIFQKLNDKRGQAECLNNIGTVYDNQGNYEQAFENYKKSLKLHEEANNQNGVAICLNNIGYFYNNRGDYDNAITYYNDALAILNKIGDRKGAAIALDNIGSMNSVLGAYNKALEYHMKSLKIKEEIGDRWGETVSLNNIGYVYGMLGGYKKALEYHNKSLKIKEEIGDQWGKAGSYNNIGAIYSALGDYEKALDYYNKALDISEKIRFLAGKVVSLNGIGRVYTSQERFVEARECLQRAIKDARECGNKELLRRVSVSSGELSLAQNNTEDAKNHTELSLKLAEELKSRQGRAEALLLQARIDMIKGKVDSEAWRQGEKRFKEAIKFFEELKQPFEIAKAYYYYGERLRVKGKTEKKKGEKLKRKRKTEMGKEYLQKAKKIFKEIGAKGWIEKCLKKS